MILRIVFHGACALILAASLVRFILGPSTVSPDRDAQGELLALLASHGFQLVEQKPLVPPETALTFQRDGCAVSVVFLPTIHRISLPARAAVALLPGAPHFLHAGRPIPSLSAWDLVPRWLALRALVNVQVEDETPWTSIALATSQTGDCSAHAPIDWSQLR